MLALSLVAAPAAAAKLYGANRCVSDKLRAAAQVCESVLDAYGDWESHQDQARLDVALGRARTKLAKAWGRAEKRVAKELDCAETTGASTDVAALIESASQDAADAVNDGLDLGDPAGARCGRDYLETVRDACGGLLRAQALHVRQPEKDRRKLRLASDEASVLADFQDAAGEARNGCDTNASALALSTSLEELAHGVVEEVVVSEAVPTDEFMLVTPEEKVPYLGKKLEPICSMGTPYHFWAKRGTVNKLVMYYQGGGACWNYLTCVAFVVYDQSVDTSGDDPNGAATGFADLTDDRNPFRDWNIVFVPYCTGDVHWGDATFDYSPGGGGAPVPIHHRGAVNARVVEKWARDHFVMPEEVFVTGSSAGAYGAIASSPALMEYVWPSSQFEVLGDAGNGVITQDFLVNDLKNWNIEKNLPRWIEALDVPITELQLGNLYIEVARQYPWNRFGTYTTSYDGGSGGQTGFYNVMINDGNPPAALAWWEASCAWNQAMREQNFATYAGAPSNFRYYIGTGSRHTMWGSDKVYTDTTGGVPTIVDWIQAMLAGTPEWLNIECTDCGTTLPGDPKPGTLPTDPFDAAGNIVCPD
jgi:hypothetical protein